MKLTYEEKWMAFDKRRKFALECIGYYFVKNYEQSLCDGSMTNLIADYEKIDRHIDKIEEKHAIEVGL